MAVADIALGYSSVTPNPLRMPRADDCFMCSKPKDQHQHTKCLFNSTTYTPLSRNDYQNRLIAWLAGQKIEEALTNIIYELTKP